MTDIRPATQTDLADIAGVLVDGWRTTFRGRLPDAFLDSLSCEQQEVRHRRIMQTPGTVYFVAVEPADGGIVGFANGGATRDEGFAQPAELYALYVRQPYQRRGIGQALFRSVADSLRQAGKSAMLVWVLADNPCRPFYQRLGGREIARRPITLGTATLDELAYAWDDLGNLGDKPPESL